jgi:hypothetical protein
VTPAERPRPLDLPLEAAVGVRPDSRAMARALAFIYLAGPTVALIALLLPHSADSNDTGAFVLIVIAYAMVPVLFTTYRRLPPGAYGLIIAFANVLVTLVIWFDGTAASKFAFFYLWATPYAFVFYSRRHAFAHVVFVGVCYAAVIALLEADGKGAPGDAEEGYWLLALSTVCIAVLLVRALTRALRENLERLERERRQHALEINDSIVQGLVVARTALDQDRANQARVAVDDTLEHAKDLIGGLLDRTEVKPGALRRERPATPRG